MILTSSSCKNPIREAAVTKTSSPRWKDAEPEIPILMAAKAEYAKLR